MKIKIDQVGDVFTTAGLQSNSDAISQNQRDISRYIAIQLLLVILLEACLGAMLFLVAPTNFSQANTEQNDTRTINSLRVLQLVNQQRKTFELAPLTLNSYLLEAAQAKADDIINDQYFSHSSPEGKKFSSWVKETGYEYIRVGENLAIHFTDNVNLVHAWMESPEHRRNILNPYYEDTGIAVSYGTWKGKDTYVVVQIFGQEQTNNNKTEPALLLTLD